MNDKFVSNVVSFALIITMGFVCMIFIDLDDIWKEILHYEQRIHNLEILTLKNMGKIGCNI